MIESTCPKGIRTVLSLTFLLAAPALGRAQDSDTESTTEVVLASEIKWQYLNPARGDAAPSAGTLWGDQTKGGASGFLVKFKDGFSSPPHIHNITYRGVVIAGHLFNDDPDAKPMWMPAGSYWTQPAGEVHITAARGAGIAFLEIQTGPYLVMPPGEAFDEGERPINVDATNVMWLNATHTRWIDSPAKSNAANGPQLAFLWSDPNGGQVKGTMVKLPAGFSGNLVTDAKTFRAVVIQGRPNLQLTSNNKTTALPPGSYFGSEGKSTHPISCEEESLLYIRTEGKYVVKPDHISK